MRHNDTGSASTAIEPFPLAFTGSGGEYFRLWIVNLLLKIVTLGFYTPFARRRTAQYFFGHTQVAGSPLEFTAQQKKMVLGFLVLVLAYVVFQAAAEMGGDTVVGVMLVIAAIGAPYLWGSAMRFRLGSTRWRGIRLQFGASWGEVYQASWPVFAAAGLWLCVGAALSALGLGLEAGQLRRPPPAAWALVGVGFLLTILLIIRLEYNYKSLTVARAFIGAQAGRWKPVYRDFVRIWLHTLGVFLLSLALVAGALALLFGGSFALLQGLKSQGPAALVVFAVLGFIAVFALLIFTSAPARAYREARMFQLVWNNVGVSHMARFRCDLQARSYVTLRVKNIVLTLLTLGFYRPFALVSEYRMKTDSVTLHVKGGLDQLVGQLVQQQGALGDAMADAAGLDLVG